MTNPLPTLQIDATYNGVIAISADGVGGMLIGLGLYRLLF
jgi:hypothetical protein